MYKFVSYNCVRCVLVTYDKRPSVKFQRKAVSKKLHPHAATPLFRRLSGVYHVTDPSQKALQMHGDMKFILWTMLASINSFFEITASLELYTKVKLGN